MATQLGLLYLLDVGASERPIDFIKDYRASWLSLGVMGELVLNNLLVLKYVIQTYFKL